MNGTQVRWLYNLPGSIVFEALDSLVSAGRMPAPIHGNQTYGTARTSMPGSKVAGGGAGGG